MSAVAGDIQFWRAGEWARLVAEADQMEGR